MASDLLSQIRDGLTHPPVYDAGDPDIDEYPIYELTKIRRYRGVDGNRVLGDLELASAIGILQGAENNYFMYVPELTLADQEKDSPDIVKIPATEVGEYVSLLDFATGPPPYLSRPAAARFPREGSTLFAPLAVLRS